MNSLRKSTFFVIFFYKINVIFGTAKSSYPKDLKTCFFFSGHFDLSAWLNLTRLRSPCESARNLRQLLTLRSTASLDLLQVDLSLVVKSERSELRCTRLLSDQASDKVSRLTCFT